MQVCSLQQVDFVGEEAEDGGGPSREFWTLISKEVSESLFEGSENSKILRHDSLALQVCKIAIHTTVIYLYCNT